nr:RecName: Full=Uncharacterized protein ENSP00000382033 [Homo sapiens]
MLCPCIQESTFETCLFMAVSRMSKWRLSRVGGSRSLPAEMEVLGEVWCVRAEEQPMTGLGIVWHSPLDKALETWSLQQQPDFSLGLGHLGLGTDATWMQSFPGSGGDAQAGTGVSGPLRLYPNLLCDFGPRQGPLWALLLEKRQMAGTGGSPALLAWRSASWRALG